MRRKYLRHPTESIEWLLTPSCNEKNVPLVAKQNRSAWIIS
jgi:hypothetical protein